MYKNIQILKVINNNINNDFKNINDIINIYLKSKNKNLKKSLFYYTK